MTFAVVNELSRCHDIIRDAEVLASHFPLRLEVEVMMRYG